VELHEIGSGEGVQQAQTGPLLAHTVPVAAEAESIQCTILDAQEPVTSSITAQNRCCWGGGPRNDFLQSSVIASWNSSANSSGQAAARRPFQSTVGATVPGLTAGAGAPPWTR
jgi:hypothetical protein